MAIDYAMISPELKRQWTDMYRRLNLDYEYQWASSTGLTAVSKFKPRLPAQWAVGTHRKGPSRMEKVTSRMNWPIRNSTEIWIRI